MDAPVYLHQFSLCCAAGLSTKQRLESFSQPPRAQTIRHLVDGDFPFFSLPNPNELSHINIDAQSDQFALLTRMQAWIEYLLKTLTTQLINQEMPPINQLPIFLGSSAFFGPSAERAFPLRIAPAMSDMGQFIQTHLQHTGLFKSYSQGCVSSLKALQSAHDLIQSGAIEHALVLGIEFESLISQSGFAALSMLSPDHIRPFCATRNGMQLGEGLAAVILSNKPSTWQLLAINQVLDPSELAGLDTSGNSSSQLWQTMLNQHQLTAQDIDIVKVQACGSQLNDAIEAHALRHLQLHDRCVSLKPWLGHTLGASGLIELLAITELLTHATWPSYPYELIVDPECQIDHAISLNNLKQFNSHSDIKHRHLLSNIIGFGSGMMSCLLKQNLSIHD